MNLYCGALAYAQRQHKDQKHGDEPYINHCVRVAERLKELGLPEQVVIAGLLHDVIEDTDASFDDINGMFGYHVATLVYSVTDEPGMSRKERKTKTYPKILSHPSAIFVKLCDRFDNVEKSVKEKNVKLLKMYINEHEEFKGCLWNPSGAEELWKELDALLERGHEICRNSNNVQRPHGS